MVAVDGEVAVAPWGRGAYVLAAAAAAEAAGEEKWKERGF